MARLARRPCQKTGVAQWMRAYRQRLQCTVRHSTLGLTTTVVPAKAPPGPPRGQCQDSVPGLITEVSTAIHSPLRHQQKVFEVRQYTAQSQQYHAVAASGERGPALALIIDPHTTSRYEKPIPLKVEPTYLHPPVDNIIIYQPPVLAPFVPSDHP